MLNSVVDSASSAITFAKNVVSVGSNVGTNLKNQALNNIQKSFTNRLIEKSIKYDDAQYKEFASYIDNQDYNINFENLYNEKSFFYVKSISSNIIKTLVNAHFHAINGGKNSNQSHDTNGYN